jgi:hypothetical protein
MHCTESLMIWGRRSNAIPSPTCTYLRNGRREETTMCKRTAAGHDRGLLLDPPYPTLFLFFFYYHTLGLQSFYYHTLGPVLGVMMPTQKCNMGEWVPCYTHTHTHTQPYRPSEIQWPLRSSGSSMTTGGLCAHPYTPYTLASRCLSYD